MKKIYIFFTALLALTTAKSQTTGQTTVVMINASTNGDGSVTLKWPKFSFTGSYKIFKNTSGVPLSFSSAVATLTATDTTWKDPSSISGSTAEYAVARYNTSNSITAVGYIYAGNKTAEIPSHGGIVVVVDSSYINTLSSEISTLKNDLMAAGYDVHMLYAGRGEKVPTVKDRIKTVVYNSNPAVTTLYLLGHIPVPYSGYFSGNSDRCAYPPDGHIEGSGNHTGAWPADVYYGDFEGIWTDNLVNYTSSASSRNYNTPGDGKFDQCAPPNDVTIRIGRVDMFNMPFYSGNDTIAIKNYLDRAHKWRMDQISYVERGLVDDNFTSLDLSATGYNILASCFTYDSIFTNRDYFPAQNQGNYLWSYGCGAGSYTNCSGVGGYNNFNPGLFNNIFTALAGSFFGDWDVQNSFLRAPLGAGSLVSFWGGIPKWYAHYFGLGLPIGYSTQVTQNEKTQSFNLSENKVHIALMGDPTLTLKNVPPAGKLQAISTNGYVKLSWGKATGKFDGYVIYALDTVNHTWTRINSGILTDTNYSDLGAWRTGVYKYAVRTIRLDNSGSGSWYNLGGGSYASVSNVNYMQTLPKMQMMVVPNPASGKTLITLSAQLPEKYEAKMFDMAGREVQERGVRMISDRALEFDLSNVPDGLYLISVKSSIGQAVEKVQIRH